MSASGVAQASNISLRVPLPGDREVAFQDREGFIEIGQQLGTFSTQFFPPVEFKEIDGDLGPPVPSPILTFRDRGDSHEFDEFLGILIHVAHGINEIGFFRRIQLCWLVRAAGRFTAMGKKSSFRGVLHFLQATQ